VSVELKNRDATASQDTTIYLLDVFEIAMPNGVLVSRFVVRPYTELYERNCGFDFKEFAYRILLDLV
jgi:hypothetical protein